MKQIFTLLLFPVCLLSALDFAFSRGLETDQNQRALRQKYYWIYSMGSRQAIQAALNKSTDLARKGQETYFCTALREEGHQVCDRMDTVSGQYEDFYQSTMERSSCKSCRGANFTQSFWTYVDSDRRLCEEPVTGSCKKLRIKPDQMREELIHLYEVELAIDSQTSGSENSSSSNVRVHQ